MNSKNIENYNFTLVEKKWKEIWLKEDYFKNQIIKNKYYVLEMLPYPSGNLHIGHALNYTIGDAIARYKRMQGFDIIRPMGWDAFGLPAENAALERGNHPAEWTYQNIAKMKSQFDKLGLMIDWSREFATCDETYYKHQQKMFIDFYKNGLAYQKKSIVNWDPVENTVLANEQVIDGRGWRSGALIEKKSLQQWFLKITDFAEELLENIDKLAGWPEKIRTMQKNWIGKSNGAEVDFKICDSEYKIRIFTTRPDTLFGCSFIAISPNHPIASELSENNSEIANFIIECNKGSVREEELATKEKEGIFTGIYCENPAFKIAQSEGHEVNGEKIPVYIANFVLMEYGTGAIFGCPAHDERDFEFAIKYHLPIKQVIQKSANISTDKLILRPVCSDDFDNLLMLNKENENNEFTPGNIPTANKSIEKITKEQLERSINKMFVIFEKHTNEFIGQVHYSPLQYKNSFYKDDDIDFGYALLKKFHNKGYATEASIALVDFIFKNNCNIDKLLATANPANIPSNRVLQKTGFKFIDNINIKDYDSDGKSIYQNIWSVYSFDRKANIMPYMESDGIVINSYFLNGLYTKDTQNKMIEMLQKYNFGTKNTTYRLKDWGVSRQRYWGCPIPIIYCEKCGILPEKLENLPIKLPKDVVFNGKGNPLENHLTWKHCKCVECGNDATRETDTLDTFFDSSWYFLRYLDSKNENIAFDKSIAEKLMPVDQYIGGAEHAVMHLLYARFFVKALAKCGYFDLEYSHNEPFINLLNQGMILHKIYKDENGNYVYPSDIYQENGKFYHINTKKEIVAGDCTKMSKSKRNVVNPDDIILTYGADAIRLFILSDTPVDKEMEWTESGVDGCFKYINKLWKTANIIMNLLMVDAIQKHDTKFIKLEKTIHKTIAFSIDRMDNFGFNKIIAKVRELHNLIEEVGYNSEYKDIIKHAFITMIKILYPIIPHISSEISKMLNFTLTDYPKFDINLIKDEEVEIAVQINGKLRSTILININITKDECELLALKNTDVAKYVNNNIIKKVIFVPGKILNFVI